MDEDNTDILKDEEIETLINQIHNIYGYDFSGYSLQSFKRRIIRILSKFRIQNFRELQEKLQENKFFFNDFIDEITVNVTEMFRDPDFYKVMRTEVIPQLSTYPVIRIWHAGCSTGEEVYSLAILLKEAGILERSLIYATDINKMVLKKASSGVFPLDAMKGYSENYIKSGGLFEFSENYAIENDKALFHDEFKKQIVFSSHNLVHDKSFNEFNLILCRNVLIYFNRDLQNKVIQLFSESISPLGFLALGTKETIEFTSQNQTFEIINKQQRVWRKINKP